MSHPVTQTVPTVGEIARRLGVPVHRVAYMLRSRGCHPVARAGNLRVFREQDVDRIEAEIRRIDAEKQAREGRCHDF